MDSENGHDEVDAIPECSKNSKEIETRSSSEIEKDIDKLIHSTSNTDKRVYSFDSVPRGFALILSNEHFCPLSGLSTRVGDEVDVENLENILKYFGLEVTVKKNLKKHDTLKILSNFRKKFREAPVSLCVVCALSHGEDGVFMDVKGDEIIIEREIVKPFYNDNCPILIGIPKLFIFSCCRGDDLAEKIQVNKPPGSTAIETDSRENFFSVPAVSDVLIVNSTIPGYVSNRNTANGTWLIQCLASVIFEERKGKDLELRELLEYVQIKMSEMVSFDGERMQTMEVINRGFLKKLYLKPFNDDKNENLHQSTKNRSTKKYFQNLLKWQ